MTEREWLDGTDVTELVHGLHRQSTRRKLLLFACGCYRRCLLPQSDGAGLRPVEVLEGYAEGAVSFRTILLLAKKVNDANGEATVLLAGGIAGTSPFWKGSFGRYHAAWQTALEVARQATRRKPGRPSKQAAERWQQTRALCVELLRCVVGNPERPPPPVPPTWLTWNGGTVPQLARALYEERRFQDLPVLADALEEAGCTDAAILSHCRGPGEHVRGCWVVDQLLGQEWKEEGL